VDKDSSLSSKVVHRCIAPAQGIPNDNTAGAAPQRGRCETLRCKKTRIFAIYAHFIQIEKPAGKDLLDVVPPPKYTDGIVSALSRVLAAAQALHHAY